MRKLFAFALMLIGLVGCQSQDNSKSQTKKTKSGTNIQYPIPVAATVGMVADLVKNVGQEYVDVKQIMGTGVDPHMHKASRDDVVAIMNADVVFYSGLMLEGKMTDTLIKVSRNKPVYAVTELINEKTLLEPNDFNGHYDPHVWMDVAAWSQCVDAVKDALSQYDPQHAYAYE
jgi:manganese/zinc/iron transport system substrate-binding protein